MIGWLDKPGHRTAAFLAVLLAVAAGMDVWQSAARRAGGRSGFDSAVSAVSYPFARALLQSRAGIEKAWLSVALGHRLAEDNERLAARVGELEGVVVELAEASAGSEREAALLSAHESYSGSVCLAHVIAIGSGGWLSYILVDVGASDGVQQKDVAVTRDGLVGQVYAVTAQTARIVPLTDPASGIAVLLRRSRETGILKGLGSWRCEVRYLDPNAAVRPGDQVLTAGSGGVFPKGLRVGTVTAVTVDPNTPGKLATVEPAAELRKVEEILVLRTDG